MNIGICDDEKTIREHIRNICEKCISSYDDDIIIETFSDGSQVTDSDLDILILDIEMKEMGGIAVKDIYQDKNRNTIIIFVTSHDEMMSQAFGVNVIGFVTKRYLENQLPVMLDTAIKKVMRTVSVEGIDSREICYIEAENVYNILHLADGREISVRISSSELEKKLVKVGFVRTHRAYLVNQAYIDGVHEKYISVDGESIPLSARLKSKIKHEYDKYCRENARFC
jgi:DNA-binding LytR/AlgR family response regulator